MARELGAGANQNRFGPPPDLDRVVGDEAVAALDVSGLAKPFVLKGLGFAHKTEAGAVRLDGIDLRDMARAAHDTVMKLGGAADRTLVELEPYLIQMHLEGS